MCRFILVTPPSPADRQHRVRVITGVGMRPPIWVKFVERFRISKVVELYGATEGNVNMGEFCNIISTFYNKNILINQFNIKNNFLRTLQ